MVLQLISRVSRQQPAGHEAATGSNIGSELSWASQYPPCATAHGREWSSGIASHTP